MVYLPMSYLYGKRFVGPITPTVLSLRKELYTIPYHDIDWNRSRNLCAKVCETANRSYKKLYENCFTWNLIAFKAPKHNILYLLKLVIAWKIAAEH